MKNLKTLKLGYFAFVIVMVALFITTLLADNGVSTGAALGSAGLVFLGFSYLRSERHRSKFPLDTLIEREGEVVVFNQIYKLKEEPLKIGVRDIHALNFAHHYLGVILNNNGRGYDLSFPYKEAELKAHLRAIIGEETFDKIRINT
ncbi:hypothetical protein [Alteromonas confluentis]|uniref:Uncharacterized protein n=1 Tax=Alteromonas confluentis TaxID=1656094 RepID=A0A1E7Z821_9ALTE|nr:hypothetical protein [Alteromonas confluentis]OFC69695.1 hypothetical protein BFC18_16635 [Alteromonas confluentis]